MHEIDELKGAPPSSGKALVRAPDPFSKTTPTVARCREARILTEKLVPDAVSEENERGRHLDTHAIRPA